MDMTGSCPAIDIPQPTESDFSTPPSSPRHSSTSLHAGEVPHETIPATVPGPSSQQPVDLDWYWEWNLAPSTEDGPGGGASENVQSTSNSTEIERELFQTPTHELLAREESSPPPPSSSPPPHPRQENGSKSSLFCIPAATGILSASYPTSPIACSPRWSNDTANFNATKLKDLPGVTQVRSNGGTEVITTPPQGGRGRSASASSLKLRSIDEMGRVLSEYVPSADFRPVSKSLTITTMESSHERLTDSPTPGPFCLSYLSGVSPLDSHPDDTGSSRREESGEGLGDTATVVPHTVLTVTEGVSESPEDKEDVYAQFLSAQSCYDVIPSSTKIVVLDTRLRVKKAFFALVANDLFTSCHNEAVSLYNITGIRSGPLWDAREQEFVGMLTITDFIHILRHHYKSPIVGMDELEDQTIQEWRLSERKMTKLKTTLLSIDPMESLYEAVKMLVTQKIHRLPVIDRSTGNAIYILTHKRLLHFLYHNVINSPDHVKPSYLFKSIGELGIGTLTSIATASPDTAIIEALNVFVERRVSALPIISSSGEVVDIYAKFDVINLAAERTYHNLDISVHTALKHRAEGFEGVHTCTAEDSLDNIITKIVSAKVHRLVIVDAKRHVVGVISLSDILRFLILVQH